MSTDDLMALDMNHVRELLATEPTPPVPAPDAGLTEVLAAVLGEHVLHPSMNICGGRCGWRATVDAGRLADQHRAHVAEMLAEAVAEYVATQRAAALREFAAKWADWIAAGADQCRGGAAYRAICEAQAIEEASADREAQP